MLGTENARRAITESFATDRIQLVTTKGLVRLPSSVAIMIPESRLVKLLYIERTTSRIDKYSQLVPNQSAE